MNGREETSLEIGGVAASRAGGHDIVAHIRNWASARVDAE